MKDIDIRSELRNNYLSHFLYDDNAKIIHEMGLAQGTIKIDIAVVNGSLSGYEIKSEQDTLGRLPAQMEVYNKVFDFINIVVNENHLKKVTEIIPEYWGIVCVQKLGTDFKLVTLRQATKNTESDSFFIAQLLWKEEALDLLNRENLIAGMKSKTRIEIWKKIADNIPKETINKYVRDCIKSRSQWR